MFYKCLDLDSISLQFKLPPSKILITGGLGFIFSHVAEWFAARGHEVHIMDNCSDGSHCRLLGPFINQGMTILKCDINDIFEYMITDEQYDYVIHAAAESNVDKSISEPYPFYKSNIRGTIEVFEWCAAMHDKHQCLKQFLYINTDEVYGSVDHPASTTNQFNPSSPYSASKAAASCIANSYCVTYGMPISEFRLCNIIGQRQANTKLIPKAIEYIKAGKEFPVYGNGSARREYMDVRLIGLIIEHYLMMCVNKESSKRIYNITTRNSYSINDILKLIAKLLGKEYKTFESSRLGHDIKYAMIPAQFIDVMPKIGIEDTIKWILTKEE